MTAIDFGLLALTGLLGALMSRTSLCTVAAVQRCVRERRWHGLRPILAATSAAGLVLVAAHAAAPGAVALPPDHRLGVALLLGALLLAAGAVLNGACYLGSVLYIGRGDSNFLFTLLGLGLAARWTYALPVSAPGHPAMPDALPAVAACVLALGLCLGLALRGTTGLAAAGVGLCAGAVFALHPGWSYGALIETFAGARHAMVNASLSAALLFAGATAGALLQHRWQFVPPGALRATRCLAGGVLMGAGAHAIPGGNDMLLLWAIPGLAAYGAVAYALMAGTVAGLLWLGERKAMRAAARA
jgi:hypothetical protein